MQKQKDANGVQHNSPGCNPGNKTPKHTTMPHPNGVLHALSRFNKLIEIYELMNMMWHPFRVPGWQNNLLYPAILAGL